MLAALLRLLLEPFWGSTYPYLLAFPAIMLGASLGGFWPGMLGTALYAAAVEYFWSDPGHPLLRGDPGALLGMLVFIAVGATISAFSAAWHRSMTRVLALQQERATLLEKERSSRADAETFARQLQTALDAGRMGTWQWTIATGEVRWSPGLEAIHGYAPGTFPGTFDAFQAEIHPEDHARVLNAISEAIKHGGEHHVEYRIVRRDGLVRWVETRGQFMLDAEGRPDRMVGVCMDTTDRKENEDAQREAKREAEEANRAKDQFLAGLSHELRTPLQAIVSYGRLLEDETLPADRRQQALATIRRNAQAQSRLVDSLLDLSRIAAGKLHLNVSDVDIAQVVAAAVEIVRPDADAKRLTIDVSVPGEKCAVVQGDSGRLEQVAWNLLTNAVKFTGRGGRVDVSVTCEGSRVKLRVSDTGQGISADFLPHVFERFSQGDTGDRLTRGGLGLGLAIVKELVAAHGGSVTAESGGSGRGSTFTVSLPMEPNANRPLQTESSPPPGH